MNGSTPIFTGRDEHIHATNGRLVATLVPTTGDSPNAGMFYCRLDDKEIFSKFFGQGRLNIILDGQGIVDASDLVLNPAEGAKVPLILRVPQFVLGLS